MLRLFQLFRRVDKIGSASGGKRVAYALGNVFLIALAIAAAYGTYWLCAHIGGIFEDNILVGALAAFGIVVCALSFVVCFLHGVVIQIALIVCAAKDDTSEERGKNIAAIVLAVLAFVVLIAVAVVLILFVR